MSEKQPKKGRKKSGIFSTLNPIWVAAIITAIVASFGALQIFGSAGQTTTYYVLNRDVPARTQITPAHLTPVVTAIGGEPPNALTPADVAAEPTFSQVPLLTGDIVSTSNAGELDRISENLPENFVVASFSVPAEDAVAGKVRKGDFIDVAATLEVDGQGGASGGTVTKIVLHRVLVLDVTVEPSSIANAAVEGPAGEEIEPGPESEAIRTGIPSTYTVAVSPADFSKLAALRDVPLYVALSSRNYVEEVNVQSYLGQIFSPTPVNDSAKGTEKARGLPEPESGEPIVHGASPAPGVAPGPTPGEDLSGDENENPDGESDDATEDEMSAEDEAALEESLTDETEVP